MKRPIVGMDLDDVLADFIKAFMFIAHELFGINPNLRPTSWEWDNTGLTRDQLNEVWNVVANTTNFHTTLTPVAGVDPDLIRALDDRTKLYFPTARFDTPGADVGRQSAHWLAMRFGINYPTVIVSPNKAEMALALKYDYFIDDRPKNCIEVKAALPDCKVYLCDSCHNKNFDDDSIPRIVNVNEFAKTVLAGMVK